MAAVDLCLLAMFVSLCCCQNHPAPCNSCLSYAQLDEFVKEALCIAGGAQGAVR